MKAKKLISTILSLAMASTVFASIANAAVSYEWDSEWECYNIANVADVTERTPSIETTVTKLTTADEVTAITGTALTAKNLKKYSDLTTYSVYKVDGTYKGVGDLVRGYDINNTDESAYVGVQAIYLGLEVPADVTAIAGVAVAEETLGATWTCGQQGTIYSMYSNAGTAGVIPKEEGLLENPEFKFTLYVVTAADAAEFSLSFVDANTTISYNVGDKDSINSIKEVKLAGNSDDIVIGAKDPEPEPTEDVVVTGKKYDKGYAWNVTVNKDMETFGVKFYSGDETLEKSVKNVDALPKLDGGVGYNFNVGLKTAKTIDQADFMADDAIGTWKAE